jgi:hypothetical protein
MLLLHDRSVAPMSAGGLGIVPLRLATTSIVTADQTKMRARKPASPVATYCPLESSAMHVIVCT